jgi:hypothetical protein
MSGFSSSAFLLWSILACLFECFLVVHLYNYDRFQCVKWGSGKQPGAFKRVMTYSYLANVPLLMVFSLVMAISSYQQGVLTTPEGKILAPPFALWTHTTRKRLLPLFFILSAAWALELVTHLEELTFWLFLLHQGPAKRDWFKSWEFRLWYLGSVVAILGMPLTVIIKRADLDMCFAWIFIAGSAAGLATTLCFIYVLVRFPGFIRRVKQEGAEPEVVVRLTTFYQLNITRIVFRFIFHFPLLILALDAIHGSHAILNNAAASDLLYMLGGIGCFVSSAITLFIFFPRSVTREIGYRVKISSTPSVKITSSLPEYQHESATPHGAFNYPRDRGEHTSDRFTEDSEYGDEAIPRYSFDPESSYVHSPTMQQRRNREGEDWEMRSDESAGPASRSHHRHHHHHHRRSRSRHETEERLSIESTESAMNKPSKASNASVIVLPHIARVPLSRPTIIDGPSASRPASIMHPYAMNFRSPIDLCDPEDDLPRAV